MEPYYLMMDVGGSGIKTGILDGTGAFLGNIQWFPARAKEDSGTIFSNFADIIIRMGANLPGEAFFGGVGMAFPGPFDYGRGISLMQGLDKYDAIYGMDIQKEIAGRLTGQKKAGVGNGCRFLFLHDVEAFALGVGALGPASACEKVFCLCIGTGAGSAFLEKGKAVKERRDVPAQGWIYNTAFRDGIIDDYVSTRGLYRLTKEQFSHSMAGQGLEKSEFPDGAALFALAAQGNAKALEVFRRFGADAAKAVIPFLESFKPDGCVIGGQIAKSFTYFGEELSAYCENAGICIYPVSDTSRWTLAGLYEKFRREER